MATTLDEATIARDANRRIRRSANIAGWTFASPSVIIVLGLSFIPMIWAAYLSLTNSNLVSPGHFIGFANYAALAKDYRYWAMPANWLEAKRWQDDLPDTKPPDPAEDPDLAYYRRVLASYPEAT